MAWFLRTSGLSLPLRSMVTRRADVFGVQSVYFRTSGKDVLTRFVRIVWTINPLDRELLLDSRVVDLLRSSATTFATFSSLKPFFFNVLRSAL